ncbi:hypothetical protein [Nocardia brasiliensis]|uniref:hypothetical protein n=1 Tax=Nocardia brasiliensis TaxID=37326 RepID=UPI0024540CF9|nr:hypothetical protein [Nocardia brasiliensis]
MPVDSVMPTHVLSKDAVRWSIDALGARRLHPTFVMYLYLRKHQRAGTIDTASASSDEVIALITMPGNPDKPYYFPLTERGARSAAPRFWRRPNIPGSWSPKSINRLKGGGWLGLPEGGYVVPGDGLDRAFSELLFGEPVSALAMGAYFLRNDGFVLAGEPGPDDLIAAFRSKFDFPAEADHEFAKLFTTAPPRERFEWFDPYFPPNDEPADGVEGSTDV